MGHFDARVKVWASVGAGVESDRDDESGRRGRWTGQDGGPHRKGDRLVSGLRPSLAPSLTTTTDAPINFTFKNCFCSQSYSTKMFSLLTSRCAKPRPCMCARAPETTFTTYTTGECMLRDQGWCSAKTRLHTLVGCAWSRVVGANLECNCFGHARQTRSRSHKVVHVDAAMWHYQEQVSRRLHGLLRRDAGAL